MHRDTEVGNSTRNRHSGVYFSTVDLDSGYCSVLVIYEIFVLHVCAVCTHSCMRLLWLCMSRSGLYRIHGKHYVQGFLAKCCSSFASLSFSLSLSLSL